MASNSTSLEVNEDVRAVIESHRKDNWIHLDEIERAVANSYVMESYDVRRVAASLGLALQTVKRHLANPVVKAYVAKIQDDTFRTDIVRKDFINAHYMELLEMAMGRSEYPVLLPSGETVTVRAVRIQDATSILREMSKSIDYAVPTNVNGAKTPVSININLGAFHKALDSSTVLEDVQFTVDVTSTPHCDDGLEDGSACGISAEPSSFLTAPEDEWI